MLPANKNLEYFLSDYIRHLAIIANGQFPTDDQIIDSIRKSKIIIACDGAIKELYEQGIVSDYVIGDGDSAEILSVSKMSKNPYIYIHDQNSNDLSKAVNFALDSFAGLPIIIYAASGLREDHSIANFALLQTYAQKYDHIAMLSSYGIFTVCKLGTSRLATLPGQQISLFTIDTNTKITCRELKWPLEEFSFNHLYSGTLNQATSNSIQVITDGTLIVYRAFELK